MAIITTTATPPGTTADGGGAVAWANPDNIKVQDAVVARATSTSNVDTNYLTAANFGFTIPTEGTILGILVRLKRSSNFGSATNYVQDAVGKGVRLLKAGTGSGDTKFEAAKYGPVLTFVDFGGASDLWGTTWTASDINNTGFGFSYRTTIVSAGSSVEANIDYAVISVTYAISTMTNISTITNISTLRL